MIREEKLYKQIVKSMYFDINYFDTKINQVL